MLMNTIERMEYRERNSINPNGAVNNERRKVLDLFHIKFISAYLAISRPITTPSDANV